MIAKKDNAGILEKLRLRKAAIDALGANPLRILETHGGRGLIGSRLYMGAVEGVAIEKDDEKSADLARARPEWRVYQADCVATLADGLAADVAFDLVDLDPWGSPWPALEALFCGKRRAIAERFVLCVNDGLRLKAKTGTAWQVGALQAIVREWGNEKMQGDWLAACRWLLGKVCDRAAVEIVEFRGFYGGHGQQMTHYYALLRVPSGTLGVG